MNSYGIIEYGIYIYMYIIYMYCKVNLFLLIFFKIFNILVYFILVM